MPSFHVARDIIISCLAAAISISGMISTSSEITVSTIETLDLENMGIAVGIFFLGTKELEIHLGVILPPPWTSEGVKNPGHLRVNGHSPVQSNNP